MELINKATLLFLFSFSLLLQTPAFADTKSYIVYLGGHPPNTIEDAVIDAHNELLGSILKDKEKAKASIFYYYKYSINGFAADLDEETAEQLSKHPKVVSVIPNKFSQLHTTHSWEFLGLNSTPTPGGSASSLWEQANYGEDVIIANFDTGVWPESASFNDDGLGPIPSKWKGICQNDKDKDFKCNRKLIGARYYNKGGMSNETYYNSPRDSEGHGTHTLSTAGGSFVPNASLFGYGAGVAKGGAPRARVAAYKVCWHRGCSGADLVAAFDDAIHDGVDVISISLGGMPMPYLNDPIALGSFHAIKNGIFVVCSAGNAGPMPFSVGNVAPWIFTVAASSIDRDFTATLSFNNITLQGKSLSEKALAGKNEYPMIIAGDARLNTSLAAGYYCYPNSLDPKKVQGKIVVCLGGGEVYRAEMGKAVLDAGGAGMVIYYDPSASTRVPEIFPVPHVLPATEISVNDTYHLLNYLHNTKTPTGYISLPQTTLNLKPAPVMASFSSQGPNPLTLQMLKPDIAAPGESILASFTNATSPTLFGFDNRRVSFNILSGTSMSCPHIAGVVALLKSANPTWSPAMIKSAIMTTAEVHDNNGTLIKNYTMKTATPFSYGAGQVSPNRAMDPGLVYDITANDYLNFLCNFYSPDDLKAFNDAPYACPSPVVKIEDLNYPVIMMFLDMYNNTMTVTRTLTNVGTPGQYKVSVQEPSGVSVTITPPTLNFSKVGEHQQYHATLKLVNTSSYFEFGNIAWSDGKHNVTIPVVVGHPIR